MLGRSKHRSDKLPQHEELLLDYAERLERHVAGRRAVHIHLSMLKPHNRREHHLRIAVSSFDNLVMRHEGQCFLMQNCDIIAVVKDCSVAQIDEVVLKLRYLFSEDPLAQEDDAGAPHTFCTWYDLEQDYPRFVALSRRMYDLARTAVASASGDAEGGGTDEEEAPRRPLDPVRLGKLEEAIRTVDLSSLLRRQAVCAVVPNQPPKPIFNEVYVSIEELRRRVLPDVNLASSRWLFQHLTEVLDLRMLKFLPEHEAEVQISTSINLNISSLLSEQFLTFDRLLRHYTKKPMIVELQPIDVFGDLGSFQFAREFVRERGYKICLDGLNHLSFPLLGREELGLDMQKVVWSPDLVADNDRKRRARFREAVVKAGPTRIVLCRCDDRRAIEFGQSLGINLFQGRHVDRMMRTGASS